MLLFLSRKVAKRQGAAIFRRALDFSRKSIEVKNSLPRQYNKQRILNVNAFDDFL